MIQRIRKTKVRNRIITVSSVVGIVFFIFTTPVISWISSLITPPQPLENLQIIATAENIKISWADVRSIDTRSIKITLGQEEFKVQPEERSFEKQMPLELPEEVIVTLTDFFGLQNSQTLSLESLTSGQSEIITEIYNPADSVIATNVTIIVRTIFIAAILVIGTVTVFGIIFNNAKSLVLMLYPTAVVIPYLFLTLSFLSVESYEVNKFLLSGIFSTLLYIIIYFLLLTANILNTSLSIKIPLEQAARASQFIFSLISSYLVLIIFFGANYNFFEKIILILPPMFYLTFAAILMLEQVTFQQATVRSLGITLTVLYAIFVLSLWPINYVYAILAIAVGYYILLSIALENRQRLSRYIWIEYSILLALVTFLLVINSSWGINGTLI